MSIMKKTPILAISSLVVGLLYILPPLIIARHLQKVGQPFVLNYNIHRDELIYMSRAKEVHDGHWPPTDLHFEEQAPTILNPIPPLIMAVFLYMFQGNATAAYLSAVFIFSMLIFLLLFWLGNYIFSKSFLWSIFFAYVGILTPMALRILNFDGA